MILEQSRHSRDALCDSSSPTSAIPTHSRKRSYAEFRDAQRDTPQEFERHNGQHQDHVADKERQCQYNYPSTRADSFTGTLDLDTPANMSDTLMSDHDATRPEDNAIINCICSFGKGVDDDDAISCDMCGTWQHTLCYFYQEPLPPDDARYLCVGCSPRDVDRHAAASRMRRKVRTLQRIMDQLSEITCEIQMREAEITVLENDLMESAWDFEVKGPILEDHDALAILYARDAELNVLHRTIEETRWRRDASVRRLVELEDDCARVKRNEPTRAEELKQKWADANATPVLWTTAASLKHYPCIAESLPPILKIKPLVEAKAEVVDKPKLKKKRKMIW